MQQGGLRSVPRVSHWLAASILLLSLTALVQAQDLPQGQIEKEINYSDEDGTESYTLYIKIEQLG